MIALLAHHRPASTLPPPLEPAPHLTPIAPVPPLRLGGVHSLQHPPDTEQLVVVGGHGTRFASHLPILRTLHAIAPAFGTLPRREHSLSRPKSIKQLPQVRIHILRDGRARPRWSPPQRERVGPVGARARALERDLVGREQEVLDKVVGSAADERECRFVKRRDLGVSKAQRCVLGSYSPSSPPRCTTALCPSSRPRLASRRRGPSARRRPSHLLSLCW